MLTADVAESEIVVKPFGLCKADCGASIDTIDG